MSWDFENIKRAFIEICLYSANKDNVILLIDAALLVWDSLLHIVIVPWKIFGVLSIVNHRKSKCVEIPLTKAL